YVLPFWTIRLFLRQLSTQVSRILFSILRNLDSPSRSQEPPRDASALMILNSWRVAFEAIQLVTPWVFSQEPVLMTISPSQRPQRITPSPVLSWVRIYFTFIKR